MAESVRQKVTEAIREDAGTAQRKTVLAVEDDEAQRELIRRAFARAGDTYDVTFAGDIAEARERIATDPPDLALVDWMLPDGKGLSLCAEEVTGEIPVVIMTGYGDEQLAVNAIKAGALDYVVKSAESFSELPHVVERALREWRHVLAGRRAEESLREGERRLAKAQRIAHIGDWQWNLQTQDCEGSDELYRILGLPTGELLSPRRLLSLVHPEDRDHWSKALSAAADHGQPVSIDVRAVRPDGTVVWIHVEGESVGNGRGRVVTLTLQDTTERKKAEQALRQSERLLRKVVDTSPTLIFVKDADGRYLMVNRAMAELYGTTPLAMTGKTDADYARQSRLGDTEATKFADDDREVIRTGQPKHIDAEPFTAADGSMRWYRTIKVPLELESNASCTLGVALDITQRRRAEQQLLQAQKMEAIGQLAGGVAHDFRNQLTVIKGFAEMLKRRNEVSDSGRDKIEQILKAADRSTRLTQQLLAFSRQEILQPAVVDLRTLVSELEKTLPRMIGEDVRLVLEPGEGPCHTELDPALFDQAVINLALNARDAMPDGGTLTIRTECTGDQAVVTVIDTGTGMDEHTREHLFEPFFTTKGVGEGTGLGLSMVYGFVTQTGGTISYHSEPGKGTTFRLAFPLAAPPEAEEVPAEVHHHPETGDNGSGTVLVVEDEQEVRQLVVGILRHNGYTVIETGNANEALPEGEHYQGDIDLLIADLVIPDMSGTELAARIRAVRPDIAVLYITGYAGQELRRRGFDDVAGNVLIKPFSQDDLLARVAETLAAREADDEH
ncbi:MAG: response regulator [Phycisphaerae bacterium]|nr:response regulator [Phycisphaerae bacterium]